MVLGNEFEKKIVHVCQIFNNFVNNKLYKYLEICWEIFEHPNIKEQKEEDLRSSEKYEEMTIFSLHWVYHFAITIKQAWEAMSSGYSSIILIYGNPEVKNLCFHRFCFISLTICFLLFRMFLHFLSYFGERIWSQEIFMFF